jgi:hypothetical protein
MALYNTQTLEKTIDDDGLVTIDVVNDGILQSDGSTVVPQVIVAKNDTDPTIPLRGIKWTNSGSDLWIEGSSFTALMRCVDGAPFVVTHLHGTTDSRWQCFIGDVEHDMLITARGVTVVWEQNGDGHNRTNAWVEIPAP